MQPSCEKKDKAENTKSIANLEGGIAILDEQKAVIASSSKVLDKPSANKAIETTPGVESPAPAASGATKSGIGSVVQMMQTINDQIRKDVAEMKRAESAAQSDYDDLSAKLRAEIATKDVKTKMNAQDLLSTVTDIEKTEKENKLQMDLFDDALKMLASLEPVCSGTTYDERVAKRKEEVAALRKALASLS